MIKSGDLIKIMGDLCTSEGATDKVLLDIAGEEYRLGISERIRTLYTITCSAEIFSSSKDNSIFTINGNTYKAVKPPIFEYDTMIFICTKQ